jgi:hypothetical protein
MCACSAAPGNQYQSIIWLFSKGNHHIVCKITQFALPLDWT